MRYVKISINNITSTFNALYLNKYGINFFVVFRYFSIIRNSNSVIIQEKVFGRFNIFFGCIRDVFKNNLGVLLFLYGAFVILKTIRIIFFLGVLYIDLRKAYFSQSQKEK